MTEMTWWFHVDTDTESHTAQRRQRERDFISDGGFSIPLSLSVCMHVDLYRAVYAALTYGAFMVVYNVVGL